MIEVQHLTKAFDAVKAVDDVSFTVEKGEILGNGLGDPAGTARMLIERLMAKDLLAV